MLGDRLVAPQTQTTMSCQGQQDSRPERPVFESPTLRSRSGVDELRQHMHLKEMQLKLLEGYRSLITDVREELEFAKGLQVRKQAAVILPGHEHEPRSHRTDRMHNAPSALRASSLLAASSFASSSSSPQLCQDPVNIASSSSSSSPTPSPSSSYSYSSSSSSSQPSQYPVDSFYSQLCKEKVAQSVFSPVPTPRRQDQYTSRSLNSSKEYGNTPKKHEDFPIHIWT